ncbi:46 kDa FK506-binding nuclear protein isoform X1 [Strongylocentrotus purpuratus]|uniref:Nucleoplasmin-like domain-containing protein n=1 Tax=Strongylocentrotus purpuratus TaxID=7668 RepID=A0A7M7N9Z9_STRPU|nr:46 kDa FK506-binding nuclear protein isoform X1 [Strongylocentrotus purpuratus]
MGKTISAKKGHCMHVPYSIRTIASHREGSPAVWFGHNYPRSRAISSGTHLNPRGSPRAQVTPVNHTTLYATSELSANFIGKLTASTIAKMFWGLTIEPGKHYSQTVDQSFHVSMAALESREKSGTTQLLVRHEKAEFLLCTLQYGDDIPYPCLQQTLELNLSEGSEISFYSEGKGTIHLTGYLVTDEPLLEEDPELVAEANSLLVGSDEEEDFDSEEEDDDGEEDDEEYSDSDMESTSSQDASCNWQQLINEFDGEDDDDSEEEEWTPESAKKSAKKAGQEKKRKSQDDSISDDLSLSAYKKKEKRLYKQKHYQKWK